MANFDVVDMPNQSELFAVDNLIRDAGIIWIYLESNRLNVLAESIVK